MPDIQTPTEFLEDFVLTAEKAKKRIYLQSMLFERGEVLRKLEPVLIKKAKEGLDVRVTTDWVSQRYVEESPNLFPSLKKNVRQHGKKVHRENTEIINHWRDKGITITFTNVPNPLTSLISIAGRNHIKMYLIDDSPAWIGGVNLFDHAVTMIDFMVKFKDKNLTDPLVKQFSQVDAKKTKDNYSVQFSPEDTLLVDAGIIGKSLIYDQALQLIHDAKKEIIFASQFLPDSKLLKGLLQAARKGYHVTIITSNKDNKVFHRFPYKIPYTYLQKEIAQMDNIKLIHREKRVHAKLLVVDNEVALFGSHNMTKIGVFLGTEEIAICTRNKKLVSDLASFISHQTD